MLLTNKERPWIVRLLAFLQLLFTASGLGSLLYKSPFWLVVYVSIAAIVAFIPIRVVLSGSLPNVFNRRFLFFPLAVVLVFLWVRGLYAAPLKDLPPLELYLPFALFWGPVSLALLCVIVKNTAFVKMVGVAFRVGMSMALLIFVFEFMLRLGYETLPGDLKVHLRQVKVGQSYQTMHVRGVSLIFTRLKDEHILTSALSRHPIRPVILIITPASSRFQTINSHQTAIK